jgi:mannose-6-phosphate isomerase
VVRADFDLYDHAFALFGLAAAAGVSEDGPELAKCAEQMLASMRAGWRHPIAGFEESNPRTLPLKANPHMHIFEAALAWIDSGHARPGSQWELLADEIGELCLTRFLLPGNGCLREFFDGDWQASPDQLGRIVEPGHQFEWGWLLIRWGMLRGRQDAILAARRLICSAERYGTDPARGIAFNEVWDDFTPRDTAARLWQQTERIKAWLAMIRIAPDEANRKEALSHVSLAANGLKKFLWTAACPGAWNERMRADGSFIDEPSPASSLYHIVCAIAEMHVLQIAT